MERYLHQPYSEIAQMTARDFRTHVQCAFYWKSAESFGEAMQGA